jgi:hypothetical protein
MANPAAQVLKMVFLFPCEHFFNSFSATLASTFSIVPWKNVCACACTGKIAGEFKHQKMKKTKIYTSRAV